MATLERCQEISSYGFGRCTQKADHRKGAHHYDTPVQKSDPPYPVFFVDTLDPDTTYGGLGDFKREDRTMGDATLWTPDGTLVFVRTPTGFDIKIVADKTNISLSAQEADVDVFTDQLREILQYG